MFLNVFDLELGVLKGRSLLLICAKKFLKTGFDFEDLGVFKGEPP